MTNLSRRSLLTGLLSSAAVIAAWPVAKVCPPESAPNIFNALDVGYLDGLGQSVEQTVYYYWTPGEIERDWRHLARVADIGFNVLDGGASLPQSFALDGPDDVVDTFPRNSNSGMVFTVIE